MRRNLQKTTWLAVLAGLMTGGCVAGEVLDGELDPAGEVDPAGEGIVEVAGDGVTATCTGVPCTLGDEDPERTARAVAGAATITSLTSMASAMRLAFTAPTSGLSTIVIYRMDKTTEGFYRRHTTVPVNSTGSYVYSDAGAVLGREYCYQVGTQISGQTRPTQSGAVCAFHSGGTLPAPPAPPTGFAVDTTYERALRLQFNDAASDETGFVVERNVFGSWVQERTLGAQSGTGNQVRFTVSDLDSEQSYCFRIKAVNANGASSPVQACGKTAALAVVDPVVEGAPEIVSIEHPAPNQLRVSWVDGNGTSAWRVKTFDGLTTSELGSASIEDHRTPPATRQSLTLKDLTPGQLYCFTVDRGYNSSRSEKLCQVPFAARTAADQRDPRPEVTPSILGVDRPSNTMMRVRIGNPQPGQIIEVTYASNSARSTRWVDAGGAAELEHAVGPGMTYCYRPWVFNDYGVRYGNLSCATATANAPARPDNLRVASQNGRDLVLDWDASLNATSYDFKWVGERPNYADDDGDKNVSGTSTSFRGYEGFEYCFSVRAKNQFGTSTWRELCGVDIADDGVTSYGTSLTQVAAGSVTFAHTVNPGGGAAYLTNVHVAGNDFTGYVVRFLPPGNTCEGNASGGIVVEPGSDLTGANLNTLYGASQPQAPVTLIGCKMIRPGGSNDLDPMPIQVTYRR